MSEQGILEGESPSGFLAAAKMVGLPVNDPRAFLKDQQQAVFAWATTAPEELGVAEEATASEAGRPRFVHYFGPVLDALRDLGGQASPDAVFAWVRRR